MAAEMIKIDSSNFLVEVDQMRETCAKLAQTKHYAKMGPDGIFAVLMMARTLNLNPFDALNGGLYSVNGKVEMSARMMNELIRRAGHSITKDPKSDHTICILHGKRADNGDTWSESFSIAEAKTAGVYRAGTPWEKYPKDMLFARALSRLARQLWPDVIKGCYIESELSEAEEAKWSPAVAVMQESAALPELTISHDQVAEIMKYLCDDQEALSSIVKIARIESLDQLPVARYAKCLAWAKQRSDERMEKEMAMTSAEPDPQIITMDELMAKTEVADV